MAGSSLMSRPFDLLVVIYMVTHIPTTMLIDAQSLVPASFFPSWARDALAWHIKMNDDHLLPFFFVAAYAFTYQCRWIRIPALIYGIHVATTLVPILGDFISYSPPKWQLAAIYVPYFIIPLTIAIRMAVMEDPFPNAPKGSKQKKKL